MIKFKDILNESLSGIDYSIIPAYVKIFKILFKNGIKGEEVPKVTTFIQEKIGLSLDESVKIAILYKFNYRPDGDYDNVKDTQWVIPSEESLSLGQRAVGDYYDITPFAFKPSKQIMHRYQPLLNIKAHNNTKNYMGHVLIFEEDVIKDMAYNEIKSSLDEEGYEFFNQSFLEPFVKLNDRVAMYNAEESAKEEWYNYLDKKGSLNLGTKEAMIEDLGLVDEYFDLKEEVEEYTKDIEDLNKEKQILEHKSNKLYQNIHIITMEIEKLSDTVDYGDDEQEYYSMYDEDISELNEKLNRYESTYEELRNQIDDIQTELYKLESQLEDVYEDYEIYNNDEKFKDLFIERRTEVIFQDMEDDIISYIWDSGYDIDGAVEEDLVYIEDEDKIIWEAIEYDGPIHFLSFNRSSFSDEFVFEDSYFYIIVEY